MLLRLASGSQDVPVSVRRIAEEQDVPYAFARSIQRDLLAAGLVEARRGAAGGMTLAKPAELITVLDIVEAVQGPLACSVCTADPDWCELRDGCRMHAVWRGADEALGGYLGSKTLAGLVAGQGR